MMQELENSLSRFTRPTPDQSQEESGIGESQEVKLPSLPPEPYVVVKNGGRLPQIITLREAVEEIVDSEEDLLEQRKKGLAEQLRKTLNRHPHARPRAHKRKVSEESKIRESFERKMRTRPTTGEYPKIDYILRSPQDAPFEIAPGVFPLTNSLPPGGEVETFYAFVCEEYPPEVLKLLKNRKNLKTVHELYFIRSTVFWEYRDGRIKEWSEAFNKVSKLIGEMAISEEIRRWAEKVADRYKL